MMHLNYHSISLPLSVIVCNIHYRSSITHNMPAWVRVFFMDYLARYLKVERPSAEIESISSESAKLILHNFDDIYELLVSQNFLLSVMTVNFQIIPLK